MSCCLIDCVTDAVGGRQFICVEECSDVIAERWRTMDVGCSKGCQERCRINLGEVDKWILQVRVGERGARLREAG